MQPILLCAPAAGCNLDPSFGPVISGNSVSIMVFHPTPGSHHRWQWGDGTFDDTTVTPRYHAYDTAGVYTVIHTETIGPNCIRFSSITITIGGIVPSDAYVAGKIFLDSNQTICVAKGVLVRFYPFDTSYHQLTIFPDSMCGYRGIVQPGKYLIRAIPVSPELIKAGYLPTFFGGVSRWDPKAIVEIGQSRFDLDITLRRRDTAKAHHGKGKISVSLHGQGTLVNGLGGATARTLNAEDVPVYVLDNTAHVVDFGILQPAAADISFTNLEAGSYVLVPDAPFVSAYQHPLVLASSTAEASVDYTITTNGIVAGVSAVKPNLAAANLVVYPNPATTQFTVRVPNATGPATVRLLATDGRTVRTQDANLSEPFTVPIQSLQAGIYQFSVSQDGRLLGASRVQVVD
jgi:PKD repeat protein